MTICPHCTQHSPPDSKFCQYCGKSLRAAPPIDATVLMTGTQVQTRAPGQQNFDVTSLFKAKSRIVVGRAPDCDICLPHPSVSRYHARLERQPAGLFLTDLSSVNGVWLKGRRITEATLVQEGDRVGIGPFLLTITLGVLHSLDNSKSLRLEARGLEKVIRLPNGSDRKLLDNVNLVINPGEFVSLLGPSGSGKSTLMDCLNGRRRATGGQVLANGEDFYRHFDNFRQSLGYVPQKDIVHTQLTVSRALYYTARLRLPLDTEADELNARIESVLQEMELVPHRDTLIADLSGGQIKRVSLGAELIGQPALLYIDEATSGLDAGTEARMMRLFRRLSDEGRSIICITHNVDNVEQCHLVLVLARGKVIYYGPPREAPRYFKVSRISEIYDRVGQRDVADWERDFTSCSLYREFVLDRLQTEAATLANPVVEPEVVDAIPVPSGLAALVAESRKLVESRLPLVDYFRQLEVGKLRWRDLLTPVSETWHQMGVLTRRYVELVRGDRRGLRLLLWQAPIVALFLIVGFMAQKFTQPMPMLRPLQPEERRALGVLRALGELLDGKQPLTAEQKQALQRIQISGLPMKLDGNGVVEALRRLLSKELSPTERLALEQARLTVTVDGEKLDVSGADLLQAARRLQEAKLGDRLLQVEGSVVPTGMGINPRFTYVLLFVLSMIVLWFGCNNAAKEIVKEEAIYGRERAVNLRIVPYLASKFLVLSMITVLHAGVLMLLLYGTLEVLARTLPDHSAPAAIHVLSYLPQFGVFVLLSMVGVALGLLLSACVSSPDRANALLPYVLIPQMILGGGILSVQHGALYYLAALLSPVYWAYRAIHLGANQLPEDFPGYVDYPDGISLPCVALVAQMAVLLVLTWWFMKRKDA